MLEKLLGYDLQRVTEPEKVRTVMDRLKSVGHNDAYWVAFQWYCQLKGSTGNDPLEQDFQRVLAAYEELLSVKNGRKTLASRTRQKLSRKSVVDCIEDWATAAVPTSGFTLLMQNGLRDLTAEHLVLKYPDRFSDQARQSATRRLASDEPP